MLAAHDNDARPLRVSVAMAAMETGLAQCFTRHHPQHPIKFTITGAIQAPDLAQG